MTWPLVALEKVADVVGGSTPSRSEHRYWGAGHFWVTPTDLPMPGDGILDLEHTEETITDEGLGSISANVLPVGTVLYSTRATIGKLAIANVPVVTNQGFNNLIAGPEIYNRYLAYALQFFTPDISRLAGTTTFKEVSRSSLRGFKIPVPPVKEQHRIADLLVQADALRRLRREADAKAARILPALFLKMFGDPATNPMGWPTDRLDRLFDVCGGGTPSTTVSEYWQGDIPWVSPKDMKVDVIADTEDHISEQAIANSATKLVEKGSVLIVYRSGILAHTFPVAIAGRSVTLNQDLKALNTTSDVSNEFLYGLLLTSQKLALSCVKKGATVHNIDGPRFLALEIPRPPKALQEEFVNHLRSLMTFKKEHSVAASRVEVMFGLLLQKAFAGELTAKWRQARMQELLLEMEQQAKALNLSMPKEIVA